MKISGNDSVNHTHRERRMPILWRHMLLMLVVLLLSVCALLIHYSISLQTLTEAKLAQTQITLERDCQTLANEMYMTSAIPDAITSTRYYEYIRGERLGELQSKYYPVLNYIRQALANQLYLQGSSDMSLLYFQGCNSICTTTNVYPIAEDCFKTGIIFPQTDPSVLIGYLQSKSLLTLLPMQQVQVKDETQEMLVFIVRLVDSPVSIMSMYTQDTILDILGFDYLPEGTCLQITADDGQILMQYPKELPDDEKEEYLTLRASLDPLRADVTVWVSEKALAQQLAPARRTGLWLIAVVCVVGLALSFALSRISVEPIRRLVSVHSEDNGQRTNEIIYLDRILNSSKDKLQNMQMALVSSLLAKVFSGAVLSEADEQILRQDALPQGGVFRAAILSSDTQINAVLGPQLAQQIPSLRWTVISPTETGVIFSAEEAQLIDAVNTLNYPIHCGISAPFVEPSSLTTAVRQARFSVPPQPGTNLFRGDRIQGHIYSRLQHERLYQSVFSSNEEEAEAILESIGRQLTLSNAREVFYNIRFTLRGAAEEMELNTDIFDTEYGVGKPPKENMDILRQMLHGMFRCIREKSVGTTVNRQEAILSWLRENAYDSELCAASVAEHFGIPEKKVYEIVRSAACMSLNEYLLSLRMKKAGELLYSTQLSVSEVAMQCGYQAESTFYRVFKKYHSVTPIQYRKNGTLPKSE